MKRIKRIITVTYKNGKTEAHNFKEIYFWKNWVEVKLKDEEKDSVCIEVNKINGITIK